MMKTGIYTNNYMFFFHKKCSSVSSYMDEQNEVNYLQRTKIVTHFVKVIFRNVIIYCIFQCFKWVYAHINTFLKIRSWGTLHKNLKKKVTVCAALNETIISTSLACLQASEMAALIIPLINLVLSCTWQNHNYDG